MAGTEFICPNCAAVARSQREIPAGTPVKCPRCAKVFRIGEEQTRVAPEPRPAPPPPAVKRRPDPKPEEPRPRPTARRDEGDDDDRPRSRRRDDEDEDDRPRSRRRDADYDDDDDRPARKKKKKADNNTRNLVIGGVFGICFLGVVAGGVIYALRPEKKTERPAGLLMPPPGLLDEGVDGPMVAQGFGDFVGPIPQLRQPPEDGAAVGSLNRDFASVFSDPPLTGTRLRRLIGPPPRAARTGAPPPAAGGGSLPPAILAKVKRATAMIVVNRADGRSGSGSGFFIGRDLVVTNAHVVGMLSPGADAPKKVEVIVNSGETDEAISQAQILTVDRDNDLALLRVPPPAKAIDPLVIVGGSNLFETQPVYIFGFPLGEQLGAGRNPEITVAPSQVSSLRKDAAGVLERVQVNGGMHPGNSGGPVVDVGGNVVGVAVSGIEKTRINFAVPGERANGLLDGHLATIVVGAMTNAGGAISVPVTVTGADPLKKLRGVTLDWWWGPSSQKVPASRTPPSEPGDRKTITLNSDVPGRYTGMVQLGNSIPPGRVLWVQVKQRDDSGETFYEGISTEMHSQAEAQPARLRYKPRRGPGRLALRSTQTIRFTAPDGELHSFYSNIETILREHRLGQDVDNSWFFKFGFEKFEVGLSHNDKPLPRSVGIRDHMPSLGKTNVELKVSNDGKVIAGRSAFGDGVKPEAQQILGSFALQIARSLEFASIACPDRELRPNETWGEDRQLPFFVPGAQVNLPMQSRLTYTGMREFHGRKVAELTLSGEVQRLPGANFGVTGKANGYLFIDLATGEVVKVNMSLETELSLTFNDQEVKASSSLDVKLQRE